MSQMADPSSGSAPTSPQFAATLQRAIVYAEEQAHRLVTAEHLLLALSEDPDAVAILQRKAIDLDQLRNEIASIVSRNNDRFAYGDAGQPIYGADLLRVLNTASGAASARRPIDGALVLAAMIADGRTPAAELIRIYGLTFEEASRAARSVPAATAHPSLASVRSSARESALGYRKRSDPPAGPELSDDPVLLPLPIPRAAPPAAARSNPTLRRPPPPPAAPPPGDWNTGDWNVGERPRTSNGSAHPNGQWRDPQQGAPADANGAAATPAGAPEWSDFDYPETEPARYQPPAPDWQDEAPRQQQARPQHPGPAEPATRRGRRPEAATSAPAAKPKTKGRKAGGKTRRSAERGILVENIPRRMQVGVQVMVEARIARHDIETALIDLGRSAQPLTQDIPIAQTIAVRLRSSDDSMVVEQGSPETQWIDSVLGILDDDFASWRWTVTPKWPGTAKLQLVISSRAVAEDGLSGEVALPDQSVEVRVAANHGARLRTAARWTAIVVATGVIGATAEHMFGLIGRLFGH